MGLAGPASIERDAGGVVTVRARRRTDAATATGFVHAQDRFFQMDLLRRSAAGELSALVGGAAVEIDSARRLHRLRSVARRVVELVPDHERELLDAYARGVNAGLDALAVRPPEYLLLRARPARWRPEDTVLAIYACTSISTTTWPRTRDRATHARGVVAGAVRVPHPDRYALDAPLVGSRFEPGPVPGPEACDLRAVQTSRAPVDVRLREDVALGSNAWAVAGHRTASGRALIANDMHLGIRVPQRLVSDTNRRRRRR